MLHQILGQEAKLLFQLTGNKAFVNGLCFSELALKSFLEVF